MVSAAEAWPRPWRLAAALLAAWMRLAPLVLLLVLVFAETRLSNPLRLVRTYAWSCLLPALLYHILARRFRVALTIDGSGLAVEDAHRRTTIPCESIAALRPWWPPLPSSGFSIGLKSGRRFELDIGMTDPARAVEAIATAGSAAPCEAALRSATLRWSEGRVAASPWAHPLVRILLFSLVVALPLFNLHQWITYGGTFGEYYLYGLRAYLLAFGVYWAMAAIWLALYDAALAAVVELALLLAALLGARPAPWRRAARTLRFVLYFGGVAAFLLRLYMLSRV